MALLTRLNNPGTARAIGIIPPLVRVATHIGYCLALAGRELTENDDESIEEQWATVYADIKEDLQEAEGHMQDPPEMSPFIPSDVIDLFETVKGGIESIRIADQTQEEVYEDLQILNHNTAYVAARYEHFTSGLDSHEGTQA